MLRFLIVIFIFFILFLQGDTALPRTVITLYDRTIHQDIWYTRLHQFAEMPLNHLGLRLEYHEIEEGYPEVANRDDVIGVLVWFPKHTELKEPIKYIEWVSDFVKKGKKFVLMGTTGLEQYLKPLPIHLLQNFWDNIGLSYEDDWIDETYQLEFPIMDWSVVEFERRYHGMLEPFDVLKQKDPLVNIHLLARRDGDESTDSVLVCTGPHGGFASEGYEKYEVFNDKEKFRKWYINPFRFFKLAFDLGDQPVPDTTTLNGKRIYYSHIDGDGWNSITELEQYRRQKMICAEVVFHELIEPYPQLPVTVGAIAADLDENWQGKVASKIAARKLFSLEQVEPSSHTYSHPFSWSFFENYHPKDEDPYHSLYVTGTWKGSSLWNQFKRLLGNMGNVPGKDASVHTDSELTYDPNTPADTDSYQGAEKILTEYEIPRAYAKAPFSLQLEIEGSIEKVSSLSSEEKPVRLYQWSGDCQPFEEAVARTHAAKVPNINGGDTRFDAEFLSYAWVRPLGRQSGKYYQVYASNSNENTYTDLWQSRFYGFKQLPETLENTDSPIRIKPINIYYHMYSGEKLASLNAVKSNLNYVLDREIAPIDTSFFSKIVEGFRSVEVVPNDGGWKIVNRGELQTLRFDHSSLLTVDYNRSKGVIGSRHLQGSLYAALDPSVETPVIYLMDKGSQSAPYPVLESCSWRIWNLQYSSNDHLVFKGKGYGPCRMHWLVQKEGNWEVTLGDRKETVEVKDGNLKVSLGDSSIHPVFMELKYMDSKSSL